MKLLIILFTLLLGMGLSAKSYAETCAKYGPEKTTLQGTLIKRIYPEQPNYTSIADGDTPATYFILALTDPICVDAEHASTSDNVAEKNIREVQLALTQEQYKNYASLVKKKTLVSATGTLFHRVTGHHHTSVLLNTIEIIPAKTEGK